MKYTDNCLMLFGRLGEDTTTLMKYYVERFMKTGEEPEFETGELKEAWFLIITDCLCQNILYGRDYNYSIKMLSKLLRINYNFYSSKRRSDIPFFSLKTIAKYRKEKKNEQSTSNR